MFITHSLSVPHKIWLLLALILASCDSNPSTPSTDSSVSTSIVNDSFPTTSSYTEIQLAKRFRSLIQEADPTPALHYQLLVPKDWQQVPLPWQPITPNHPSQLQDQLQAPKNHPPVQLRVVVLSLDDEVSPADILFANLARHGDKIIRQELTSLEGGVMPDVLALSGEKGSEQITRWTIRKNTVPRADSRLVYGFGVIFWDESLFS